MNKVCLTMMTLCGLMLNLSCTSEEEPTPAGPTQTPERPSQPIASNSPVYEFELVNIDGQPTTLDQYRGKVLLLVNVASQCGYTKQYAGLQSLNEKYEPQGLVVVGFPANNFGNQEPGTNDQIKQFCSIHFGITFPMFAKVSVKGQDIHPLYRYLTEEATNPQFAGEISWNFNKFLVGRSGAVIGRYGSAVEPLAPTLVADIEKALGSTAG